MNPNPYIRPYSPPQNLKRDKQNDDQNVQPPFGNNFVDDPDEHDIAKPNDDIHLIEVEQSIAHLTQDDYEYSMAL